MNKLFLLFMIFTVSLWAREEAFAAKECPAFNNMKHSKNTHAVHLDTKQKYTVLKYHKGQALVLIKGEQPAQRWVDDECFSKSQNGDSDSLSIEEELSKSSGNIVLSGHAKKYKQNNTNEYDNPELKNINKTILMNMIIRNFQKITSWHSHGITHFVKPTGTEKSVNDLCFLLEKVSIERNISYCMDCGHSLKARCIVM